MSSCLITGSPFLAFLFSVDAWNFVADDVALRRRRRFWRCCVVNAKGQATALRIATAVVDFNSRLQRHR
ncbi:hypothetical protein Nepgr_018416 [Nepenthes gracilis]|uniref:Secreted protein n=1 Tax=Nepenthes gracilis TaxID=150966 RepID=A0AAD3XU93_NEPGR|nr:hypothetical protein Nepgr_018416 [Nepenthes gracilis]